MGALFDLKKDFPEFDPSNIVFVSDGSIESLAFEYKGKKVSTKFDFEKKQDKGGVSAAYIRDKIVRPLLQKNS